MRLDKHIYFSDEEVKRINDYSNKNKITFTKATCRLIDIALDNIEVMERLDTLQKNMEYLTSNTKFIFLLLQQLYSDLDFENITDPKKSKSVIEFMKKLKGYNFDD